MKTIKSLFSSLFLVSCLLLAIPVKAHPVASLDRLLFDHDLKQQVSPNDPLWRVVAAALWNSKTGELSNSDLSEVKNDLKTDKGAIAEALMSQGFNYHVLNRLRWVLGIDPLGVDYGVVDLASFQRTVIGNQPAGIAEFTRISTNEWNTSAKGELVLRYHPKIQWLLEKARLLVDSSVLAAGQTPHSLRNLFVNRYKQVSDILNFMDQMEKILIKIQGLKSSFEIKKAGFVSRNELSEDLQISQLISEIDSEISRLLEWITPILDRAQPGSRRNKRPWENFAQAIREQQNQMRKNQLVVEKLIANLISQVHQIGQQSTVSNKYEADLEPELELARRHQIQQEDEFEKRWAEIKNRPYYRRTHTWDSIHLHSEQHSPYYETSRETKKREIFDIDPAPIEEEIEVADRITSIAAILLKAKPQQEQILSMRRILTELKQEHLKHFERGPQLEPNAPSNLAKGFNEQFQLRNQLLQDWMDMLIDTSYRHEAHERLGYVGLELDKVVDAKYESILNRLQTVAKRFRVTAYSLSLTTGGAIVAGACGYLLTH